MPQYQQKTKFPGVYSDKDGKYFLQTEFGRDRVTGKRVRKKSRVDQHGNPFKSAADAYKELIRLKHEYHQSQGYSNYRMKYRQFMEDHYIPYYRTTVEHSTFSVREKNLLQLCDRFGDTTLRSITLEQVQMFRTWLLTSQDEGGAGYSQGYASLIFGMFRKSLDYALQMGYVEKNISKQSNAIPKGKVMSHIGLRANLKLLFRKFTLKMYMNI